MTDATAAKPLPKSLHTISVLQVMARALAASHPAAGNAELVALAIEQLGLSDRPDAYGLAAAAIKVMGA